jgi:hypothetical protein
MDMANEASIDGVEGQGELIKGIRSRACFQGGVCVWKGNGADRRVWSTSRYVCVNGRLIYKSSGGVVGTLAPWKGGRLVLWMHDLAPTPLASSMVCCVRLL